MKHGEIVTCEGHVRASSSIPPLEGPMISSCGHKAPYDEDTDLDLAVVLSEGRRITDADERRLKNTGKEVKGTDKKT
jgi:hypothetical protein